MRSPDWGRLWGRRQCYEQGQMVHQLNQGDREQSQTDTEIRYGIREK